MKKCKYCGSPAYNTMCQGCMAKYKAIHRKIRPWYINSVVAGEINVERDYPNKKRRFDGGKRSNG